MISLIVAISQNGVIGSNGKIPWHFKTDLNFFKEITMGNVLVFGRKTYESIKKNLEGRKIIVITRNKNYIVTNAIIKHSPYDILDLYLKSKDKCFIGGGSDLYNFFIDYAQEIYLTQIEKKYNGDAFFPIQKLNEFYQISCREISEKGVILKFKILKRRSSSTYV
ncbi:MAG: dihydrofolate reductase [Acidobacteria bacterium]|nr:dihydrofolate reductase [Acidobacteriota bacterium]